MGQHLDTILEKMCSFVGVELKDIDTTKDGWYMLHCWTPEQEKTFLLWLEGYLWANRKYAALELTNTRILRTKKQARELAQEIVLQWGWTCSVKRVNVVTN